MFLYPSTHNYNALDVVKEGVIETLTFSTDESETVHLEGNLTVLGFFGNNPMDKLTAASNLKELIYDKFKGFKKFQILILIPYGADAQVELLRKELLKYDKLKYWRFAYGKSGDINRVFKSLETKAVLSSNFATDHVFIIDKESNQRGRLDDRTEREVEKNKVVYNLTSYNCIEVAEIKNKMSEDLRILFTEYRQKRKGNFDSSSRRADDIETDEKN